MATEIKTIDEIANWSPARRVETRQGPRMLRTATPGDEFWAAWRGDKQAMKDAGVSVKKDGADWQACWWLPLDDADQAKVDEAQQASRATNADVEIPAPDGLEYMPYQKAGIAYGLARENVLIGDEMGLGKTIQAIGIINADPSIRRVLVICPASLRLNWKRELDKWLVRPMGVAVVEGGKKSDWPSGQVSVIVINYDVAAKHRDRIDAIEWDLLIGDEIHYCKNPQAARTKAVFGHKTKKGEVKQTPIKARRRVFLTGTPIVNRPVELWPLVESADPAGLGRNFFAFANKYCNAHHNGYGWDFSGASNLETLQRLLRERFMVRRLKADVLKDLPPKRRQVIELPANGAAGAIAEEKRVFDNHRAYIADLEARLAELEVELSAAEYAYDPDEIESVRRELADAKRTAFTEMSKARHAVALAKAPKVIEHLEAALENGPVVCFAHHKDVVREIADAFPGRAVTLTGETPMQARQDAVDAFQRGDADLFVGNIQAAGVGITLTRSSHVVFAELDWVPGNLSQAEDRCHRIGQANHVLVQHLVLEDSVDSELIETIVSKQEVIEQGLDAQTQTTPATGQNADVRQAKPKTDPRAVKVELKKDPKDVAAEALTESQIAAIHTGLRILAGACDGARELDGCGFNKMDTTFGKQLAYQPELTMRQALSGQRLCVKYQRQLPAGLLATIKGEN